MGEQTSIEHTPRETPVSLQEVRSTEKNSDAERKIQDEITRLASNLGDAAVRPANPGEFRHSCENKSDEATIQNPSDENLAITIAIRGEEKRLGNRMASIGHEVLVPAKSSLAVRAVYWTTPETTKIQPGEET